MEGIMASEKTSFPRLRRFNLIMGFLHLIQGVFMWVVSNDSTRPVYTSFLKFDLATFTLSPDPQVFLELRFGPAIAIFLLLSAVAHFYLSTIGFKPYVANLERGKNPIRFFEYALSSSVMIVVIALLVGIYELAALIALFGVNAAMNLFGNSMEDDNEKREKVRWASFVYGCVAGIVPWIVIAWYFLASVTGGEQGPPGFVYAIVPTLFVFFNIFAVNMILQYKKVGPWKNYLFGERVYIVLSLFAKSVLAWIIWSGTMAPV
jgi:hypothetical protein